MEYYEKISVLLKDMQSKGYSKEEITYLIKKFNPDYLAEQLKIEFKDL